MVESLPGMYCVDITINPDGTGDNGADDLVSGTTAGIDNKMIMMGGIAILGVLLLVGGSKAARKDKP